LNPKEFLKEIDDAIFERSQKLVCAPLSDDCKEVGDNISRFIDEISSLEKDKFFTRETCGTIARLIITAWAHQVKIVVWDEEELTDELKRDEDAYLIFDPEKFPHTSALGGA
jgi:hypothetical protein